MENLCLNLLFNGVLVALFVLLPRLTLLLSMAWVYSSYRVWQKEFGHRVDRRDPLSPSFFPPPELQGTTKEEMSPSKMDMNHVRITFPQYLFGSFFVGIQAFALLFWGLGKLHILRLIQKMGFLERTSEEELRRVAACLLLETSMSIHFVRQKDGIAQLSFPKIPVYVSEGEGPWKGELQMQKWDLKVIVDTNRHLARSSLTDTCRIFNFLVHIPDTLKCIIIFTITIYMEI